MHYSLRSKLYLGFVIMSAVLLQSCVMTQGSQAKVFKEKDKYYYIADARQCKTHRSAPGSKVMCFDDKEVFTTNLTPITYEQAVAYSQGTDSPIYDPKLQARNRAKARGNNLNKKYKGSAAHKKVTTRRFGAGPAPAKGEFFARKDNAIFAPDGSTCKKQSDASYACTNGVVYTYKSKDHITATDGRDCSLVKGSWQCKVQKKFVITM